MNGERAEEMTVFVRAVELGGFSAAARALGLTPSAVSKGISRLEDRLGVRLLNRTTRSLTLTPEGATFLERSRRILADIDEAEQEVARFRSAPRGRLRLHISVAFGLHQLPPALPEFLTRYPDVDLDISVSDREPDLAEEGIDLAVRSGEVADQSLIARRICLMERVICAAPAYLKKHGTPRTPDDLLQHNCLLVSAQPNPANWPFRYRRRHSHRQGQRQRHRGQRRDRSPARHPWTRCDTARRHPRRRALKTQATRAIADASASRRTRADPRHVLAGSSPFTQGRSHGGLPARTLQPRTLAPAGARAEGPPARPARVNT